MNSGIRSVRPVYDLSLCTGPFQISPFLSPRSGSGSTRRLWCSGNRSISAVLFNRQLWYTQVLLRVPADDVVGIFFIHMLIQPADTVFHLRSSCRLSKKQTCRLRQIILPGIELFFSSIGNGCGTIQTIPPSP